MSRDPSRTEYAKPSQLATWAYELADAMIAASDVDEKGEKDENV